jgi:cytochrome c oxidase subunit IV
MSQAHEAHDIQADVKRYLIIGVALMIGTALTVWASLFDFDQLILKHPGYALNITVALIIASAKGFLVAGFFMHLISERKMIYTVMAFTTFFFAALMYLTVWSMQPDSLIHFRH